MKLFLSNLIYAQLLPDKRGWTVADSGSSSLDQKSGNPTEIAGAPDGRRSGRASSLIVGTAPY
jgi:hypothetical protein